jgi:hypothetical protein
MQFKNTALLLLSTLHFAEATPTPKNHAVTPEKIIKALAGTYALVNTSR